MNQYRPPIPAGNTPFADWAQKTQAGIYNNRRVLFTPDTLTTQMGAGVFHRPKPVDESRTSAPRKFFTFSVSWIFPAGAGDHRDNVQIIGTNIVESSAAEYGAGTGSNSFALLAIPATIIKLAYPILPGWAVIGQVYQNFYGQSAIPDYGLDNAYLRGLFNSARLTGMFTSVPYGSLPSPVSGGFAAPLTWQQSEIDSQRTASFAVTSPLGQPVTETYLACGFPYTILHDLIPAIGNEAFPAGIALIISGIAYQP